MSVAHPSILECGVLDSDDLFYFFDLFEDGCG